MKNLADHDTDREIAQAAMAYREAQRAFLAATKLCDAHDDPSDPDQMPEQHAECVRLCQVVCDAEIALDAVIARATEKTPGAP